MLLGVLLRVLGFFFSIANCFLPLFLVSVFSISMEFQFSFAERIKMR